MDITCDNYLGLKLGFLQPLDSTRELRRSVSSRTNQLQNVIRLKYTSE
jgi:hypothetical protein